MIPHGLGDSWGGGMILKNPPPGGVMIVKTGGAMILKNPAPKWGHVSEKSQFGTFKKPLELRRLLTTKNCGSRRNWRFSS